MSEKLNDKIHAIVSEHFPDKVKSSDMIEMIEEDIPDIKFRERMHVVNESDK